MKKIFILIALTAMFFVGCKSTNVEKQYPNWVTKEPVSKSGIYAVGSADVMDPIICRKMAEADAVNNLSKKISSDVNVVTQTNISGSNINSVKGFEENAIQKSHSIIEGYIIKDYFSGKNGKSFMLIYLPYETNVTDFESVLSETQDFIIAKERMDDAYDKFFTE